MRIVPVLNHGRGKQGPMPASCTFIKALTHARTSLVTTNALVCTSSSQSGARERTSTTLLAQRMVREIRGCAHHLLDDVQPQAGAPLHGALLEEQNDAVRRGGQLLNHGQDLARSALGLALTSFHDESRRVCTLSTISRVVHVRRAWST